MGGGAVEMMTGAAADERGAGVRASRPTCVFVCVFFSPVVSTFVVLECTRVYTYDPRPFVVEHFGPLISHKPSNGFPSDHVLWSAATAAIIFPSSKYLSLLLWVLTILVGAARVHAGVHHPIDIVGSMLMAIVAASILYLIIRRMKMFRDATD